MVTNLSPFVWMACLAIYAVVLIAIYRERLKCPRCGSIRARRAILLPGVLHCRDCHEIYEVRL